MVISLEEKFLKVNEYWHPYIVGELNDSFVKIAKVKGHLVWHSHDNEDEYFGIVSGTLFMDFPDRTVTARAGDILIVPKGVLHRPWTNGEEVKIILIEPKSTKHTGDVRTNETVDVLEWI